MAQKKVTVAADKKKAILQASAEKPAKVSGKPAEPKPAGPKRELVKPAPADAKKPTAPVEPAAPAIKPAAPDAKKNVPATPPPTRPQPVDKEIGPIQVSPPPVVTPAPNIQFTVPPQAVTFGSLFPNSDVFSFSGPMFDPAANLWSKIIRETKNKDHHSAVVFFCSLGGSADEAFRMMRMLQNFYQDISVVVFGKCYSAATLFALGANKILMSEDAQLGPLDVQISKEDDNSRMSGECYRQALVTLGGMSSESLKQLFVKLKNEMGFPVSTGTASRIASEIVVGLFAPITQQIEPAKLGDVVRAQGIGHSYGLRLMNGRYSAPDANKIATRLAYGYPSHTTVIDFEEAKSIGLHVEKISVETFRDGRLKAFSESLLTPEQGIVIKQLNAATLQ